MISANVRVFRASLVAAALVGCSSAFQAPQRDSSPTAAEGLGTDAENEAGGAAGSDSGSGSAVAGPAVSPDLFVPFQSERGFVRINKAEPLPGGQADLGQDAAARDGRVLRLRVPGALDLGDKDFVGPGRHAVEIGIEGSTQLYGRAMFRVKFPTCAPNEDLVSGLFTYFNDGTDEDESGVSDNSEIDIEHLCGDPRYLWLSVWTDYQASPAEVFKKTTRLIDMRTGNVQETPPGFGEYGGLMDKGSLDLSLPSFPDPGTFYELGFEWSPGRVSYFLIVEGRQVELWRLLGNEVVPSREAEILVNLWHPDSHWSKPGGADYPSQDAVLVLDEVSIWRHGSLN